MSGLSTGFSFAILFLSPFSIAAAKAQIDNPCWAAEPDAGCMSFGDINVLFNPAGLSAAGISVPNTEASLREVVGNLNEQSWGFIRLSYGGTTTATQLAALPSNTTLVRFRNPCCNCCDPEDGTGAIFAAGDCDGRTVIEVMLRVCTPISPPPPPPPPPCEPPLAVGPVINWNFGHQTAGPSFQGVMFHEFGHALFALPHVTSFGGGCESTMYPDLVGQSNRMLFPLDQATITDGIGYTSRLATTATSSNLGSSWSAKLNASFGPRATPVPPGVTGIQVASPLNGQAISAVAQYSTTVDSILQTPDWLTLGASGGGRYATATATAPNGMTVFATPALCQHAFGCVELVVTTTMGGSTDSQSVVLFTTTSQAGTTTRPAVSFDPSRNRFVILMVDAISGEIVYTSSTAVFPPTWHAGAPLELSGASRPWRYLGGALFSTVLSPSPGRVLAAADNIPFRQIYSIPITFSGGYLASGPPTALGTPWVAGNPFGAAIDDRSVTPGSDTAMVTFTGLDGVLQRGHRLNPFLPGPWSGPNVVAAAPSNWLTNQVVTGTSLSFMPRGSKWIVGMTRFEWE